ncbi:MAG: carboxylesterase family protein [Lachnospiraceae bacterium]|nr:carboxylesterase family protein [Lachnospiraceae bacterium]
MENCVVKTEYGLVEGTHGWNPRIHVFKGIPYAAPPVGELRWKKPEPAKPWEGIRKTLEFEAVSMQVQPGSRKEEFWTKEMHPAGPELKVSEDCLYLNVFTPAKDGEKLPVLFYIHGGGFSGGYPFEIEFDWENVAKRGVVVVAPAYRLGVLGFLAHPELSSEAPGMSEGNFGLLDQLEALRWTKRNIEAFGGDPEKITIAGQSAGAGSVQLLMTSPCVEEGLIRGAVIESGITIGFGDLPSPLEPVSLEKAEKTGKEFFELLGVDTLEEARKIPAEELIRTVDEKMGPGFHFQPVIDGVFLKETPASAYISGRAKRIPVLAGYNRGEISSFWSMFMQLPENTHQFDEFVKRYGDAEGEIRRIGGIKNDNDVRRFFDDDGFSDMITGTLFFGQLWEQYGLKVFLYEFDADIPGDDKPGSYHGCEMWFAYDSLARCFRPFRGKHYDLAEQVSSYWVNFVKTADPNGTDLFGTELPGWKAFDSSNEFLMLFKDEPEPSVYKPGELMKFRIGLKNRK